MTDEARVYDFAIVGAGVSGLVLARALRTQGSVLLVDGARDDTVLRTLSFWRDGADALDTLVRHRYRMLTIADRGALSFDVRLSRYEYRTLFFADLQRDTKALLVADARHRVLDGRARAVRSLDTHAELTVGDETLRARWVFDSRFHLAELRVDARRYHDERQHFRGWIVRAPREVFDPDRAHFMDFRSSLARGRAFFYVLPFSRDTALVELVSLDAGDLERELDRYLREAFALDSYEVLEKESGVSPMTEQPFARRLGPRVRAIGVLAGRLKPSTGYALTRIVDDTDAIVRSLRAHGHPFEVSRPRRLFAWLDAVFLDVWKTHPSELPSVFVALFAKNEGDAVLFFLDERARLGAIVRLAFTLPIVRFVLAALRVLVRRAVAPLRREPPRDAGAEEPPALQR